MPPKGKRSSVAEDAFLFVNEDFSTLFGGAKNSDLDRSKQSHVQRQSFAKRKKVRKGGPDSSATSPTPSEDIHSPLSTSNLTALASPPEARLPLLPFSASPSLWLPAIADEDVDLPAPEILPPASTDTSNTPAFGSPAFPPRQSRSYQYLASQDPLPEISPFASSSTISPVYREHGVGEAPTDFGAGSLRTSYFPTIPESPVDDIQQALEKWTPVLMRYFTRNILPEFFHTDLQATSLHTMRHVEFLHEDMRSCMSDPAEMYALLAACACDVLVRGGKPGLSLVDMEDLKRATLLFKFKAFEALRLRLSRGEVSHGIVIAIQRMICAALFTNSFSAVEAHYRAELSMIKSIGGLETFNDFQKERLIMHDFHYAVSTRSLPRLEVTWDPGDLSPDVNLEMVIHMNQHDDLDVGGRFRAILEDSTFTLDPTVAQCIPQLVEAQQVLEWLRDGPYRSTSYRWLAQRRLAIAHRLLSAGEQSSSSSLELVRLALLYYYVMIKVFPCSRRTLVDQYMIPELRGWDAGVVRRGFSTCTDLLLWVIVVFGIGIAKQIERVSAGERAFSGGSSPSEASASAFGELEYLHAASQLSQTGRAACRQLGIMAEADLRRRLRTFLFGDDLADDTYMKFATVELQLTR